MIFQAETQAKIILLNWAPEPVSDLAAKNAANLRALGVTVRFNVDAASPSDLSMGNSCKFSSIVFMFPHVGGKMQV